MANTLIPSPTLALSLLTLHLFWSWTSVFADVSSFFDHGNWAFFGSHRAVLRLRRSQHIDVGRVPVYTVGDDQKVVRAQLPEVTEAAVYSDIHQGAAVLVKRPHGAGTEFQLHGTVHMGDKEYTISPSPSSPPSGGATKSAAMLHILRAIQNDQSYGQDYVEPDPPAEEVTGERSGTNPASSRGRRRRQATRVKTEEEKKPSRRPTGRHNIDINIVCDYACFKRFYNRHDQSETRALEEARLYFSYLAQSVDVRFRSISEVRPDVVITVTPISIITSKTANGSLYSEESRVKGTSRGVDGNRLLKSFRTWVDQTRLPTAPTTVLQTGYNMMTNGDTKRLGQLGIAYRGGACSKSGVVVVEEKFHGVTGMITAHEIGHNVNSKHDGAYRGGTGGNCTGDSARHVMSTYVGVPQGSSKPWSFSPCSADVIADFVSHKKRRDKCFPDNYERIVADDAGQIYTADDQCAIAFGSQSYLCRGHQYQRSIGFEGMCTKMYCSVTPARGHTCTAIVPFQYTSCGHKKWCIDGQCVYDEKAPSKIKDSCPQGDDPTYGCRRDRCSGLFLPRQIFCCETCQRSPGISLGSESRLPSATTNAGGNNSTRWQSVESSAVDISLRPTTTTLRPPSPSGSADVISSSITRTTTSVMPSTTTARATTTTTTATTTTTTRAVPSTDVTRTFSSPRSSLATVLPPTSTTTAATTTTTTPTTTVPTTTTTTTPITTTPTTTTTTTPTTTTPTTTTTTTPTTTAPTTTTTTTPTTTAPTTTTTTTPTTTAPTTTTTTTPTTTAPTTTTTTLEATTAIPLRTATAFLPSICRVSREWCLFCIRWSFRFSFCRN